MLSARALPQILPVLATLALGWSTAAVAETEATGTVAPPIQVEAYRLTASDAAVGMRTDVRALSGGSVFADDTGRAMLGRTRFLGTAPWGTALTIEMSRPALSGLRRSWGALGWRAGARLRLLASQPMAGGALVLGLGAGMDRRRMRGLPSVTDRTYSSSRTLEFGWVSEDRWRLTLGSQTTSGGSGRLSGARLIDLASGAPLREHGPRLTLAFADRTKPVGYGFIASSATLSAHDAEALGRAASAKDNRASLFWLSRF
jgi:hypothetical protein